MRLLTQRIWPEGTLALIKSVYTHGDKTPTVSLMLGKLLSPLPGHLFNPRVWTIVAARPPANVWTGATVCTGQGNIPRVLRRIRLDELPRYMTWAKAPSFDSLLKGTP